MTDDLLNQARENASERPDADWGERVTLEPGDSFLGRWRGQTSTASEYGEQPVYLLWDREGVERFLYGGRATLDRKIEQLAPGEGDEIAIYRESNETTDKGRTVHRYGVASQMTMEELPSGPKEPDW